MKLLIIDSSGYFHRCFHAYPQDPAGEFRAKIETSITEYAADRVFFALDVGKETFRNRIFPGYKANRPPPPEGFHAAKIKMEGVIRDFADEYHVEVIGVPDYEADDVIGSLCHSMGPSWSARVLSHDKDLNQLVIDNGVFASVEQCDPNGVVYREANVVQRWGVQPLQIPEVLGLSGDQTDNIPGVVGIGKKIATQLIQWYGTIENVYAKPNEISYLDIRSPELVRKKLEAGRLNALMSRDLATVRRNIL